MASIWRSFLLQFLELDEDGIYKPKETKLRILKEVYDFVEKLPNDFLRILVTCIFELNKTILLDQENNVEQTRENK